MVAGEASGDDPTTEAPRRPWGRSFRASHTETTERAAHAMDLTVDRRNLAHEWAQAYPSPVRPISSRPVILARRRSPLARRRSLSPEGREDEEDGEVTEQAGRWTSSECHPFATNFPETGVTISALSGLELALEAFQTNNPPSSSAQVPAHYRWHCKYCYYSTDFDGEIISHFHRFHFTPVLTIGQVRSVYNTMWCYPYSIAQCGAIHSPYSP